MKKHLIVLIGFILCGQVWAESHVTVERDNEGLIKKIVSTIPDSKGACLLGGYTGSVYLSHLFASKVMIDLGLESPSLTTEDDSPSDFTVVFGGIRFGTKVSARFSINDDCGLLKINWIELIEGAEMFEFMIGDVEAINMELGRP